MTASASAEGTDTIAAIATAPGFGGIGVVRVSGPAAAAIAAAVTGAVPPPRHARFARFRAARGEVLDEGIVLYFQAPASFTGEDVLELQGHGGPVVMDLLLARVLEAGARPARPGEFSERAFLNGRIDLTQAEAIADLIASGSARAARSAANSLSGAFAERVDAIIDGLVDARAGLEALLDFPDEEIEEAAQRDQARELEAIAEAIGELLATAEQGSALREGISAVLTGLPNVGKSSLLNALARQDRAIVSPAPGTTRDLLREQVLLHGLPVELVDTAGLRAEGEAVEMEGMRRARAAIGRADTLVLISEHGRPLSALEEEILAARAEGAGLIIVRNKIDITGVPAGHRQHEGHEEILLCARTGEGLELLERALFARAGGGGGGGEGELSARRRHCDALARAGESVAAARGEVGGPGPRIELAAEHLRLAQLTLAEITGAFTADDLLGEIFSSFCIGK